MQTLDMPLMPKSTTKAVRMVMTMPLATGGMCRFSSRSMEMALDCTMLPMPKEATTAKMAKSTPSHLALSPRSRAYIGPPRMCPSFLIFTRYFTASRASEYFVAIPNTPVSQHQSTAPGPPRVMAVATPTMLPVPMVAAKAVAKAPNWLTSPCSVLSLVTESLMALNILS